VMREVSAAACIATAATDDDADAGVKTVSD